MNEIIPSDERTTFVTALREFADFLEANPTAPIAGLNWQGAPVHVNPEVEVFASEQGATPVYDAEGNASVVLRFGPIEYRVYGYADFDEHCERSRETNARTWAEQQGLEIVKPLVSDDTIRQADAQLAQNIADREGEFTQPAPDTNRIVAYRSNGGRLLRCLAHSKDIAGDDFVPVASEDLPDGGICTYPDCGRDVLIGTGTAGGTR